MTDSNNTQKTRNQNMQDTLHLFSAKMKVAALPEQCITTFSHYFQRLFANESGFIPEDTLRAVPRNSIPTLQEIQRCHSIGIPLLAQTAFIKLNGGLGTTMGCNGPKSLIQVKKGYSFLEIIIQSISSLNKKYNVSMPLILMNSFNTESETKSVLARFPNLNTTIPTTFIQHQFPKVLASTLEPAVYPENRALEWNPPGHGDIYLALQTSGILEKLLHCNFKYAFISNSDNLNAHPDPSIPGYMEEKQLDFLMEVANRTPADCKGGHIAQNKNGGFLLREIAQCPTEDLHHFQDIDRHHFFNTNNLWINLNALRSQFIYNNGIINLPMICNRKHLNPLELNSPTVFQLESAMGSIISLFKKSAVLRVPRTRFLPVKTINDLLLLQSDFFSLTPDFNLTAVRSNPSSFPTVFLDPDFYRTVAMVSHRFPQGIPSMYNCTSFSVKGNVFFGNNISLTGAVSIDTSGPEPVTIPNNTVLNGTYHY